MKEHRNIIIKVNKAVRTRFKQRVQYNNYKAFVAASREKNDEDTKRNYNR
jgi:hypothetical protein